MDTWLVVLILVQFPFLAFLIWIISSTQTAKDRQRAEERMRLLERFETSEELERFLTSEAGRTYLQLSEVRKSNPKKAIVLTVALGVVALALGGGMAFLTFADIGAQGMIIPGAILSSLGVGLFGAAFVSLYLLRRVPGDSDSDS